MSQQVIDRAVAAPRLSIDDRAERLLEYLVAESGSLGTKLSVSRIPLFAWTESTELTEVLELETYLEGQDWIEPRRRSGADVLTTRVTVEGHRHLEEKVTTTDTTQVFVAMWFDESMASVYREGIAPAIRDTGHRPHRIDEKEHINKIDEEIILEIRRSKFLVADFTEGRDGARGGVYYEAGFAQGIGLPVVFMCHANSVGRLHFDTNHYNHIVWSSPEDVREKLRTRILAVIGDGPARGN